jgi:hypothetical protein
LKDCAVDVVERLIAYRDREGRSREGRDLLADACNEIQRLRKLVPFIKVGDGSVECPHCHWGFHPSVIAQHIREKH